MRNLIDRLMKRNNGQSLEQRLENIPDTRLQGIPAYLVYPMDPIARIMFGEKMKAVSDMQCGYQFMLYTDIADTTPEIRKQQPAFDINETHIFWKQNSDSFISVSTMKGPSVKTSNLRGWVESSDQLGQMLGAMTQFLNLPSQMAAGDYRRVKMHYLGDDTAYNKLHNFDETHTYCHIFYLGDRLYKKFILCARRGISSWKVECTIPSVQETLSPADMMPPGMVFGSFFTVK